MEKLMEMSMELVLKQKGIENKTLDEAIELAKVVFGKLKAASVEDTLVSVPEVKKEEEQKPEIMEVKYVPDFTVEESFGETAIRCLLCGEPMVVLKQHLTRVHRISQNMYRLKFGIDRHRPLVAKEFHEKRSVSAVARGFGKGNKKQPDKPVEVKEVLAEEGKKPKRTITGSMLKKGKVVIEKEKGEEKPEVSKSPPLMLRNENKLQLPKNSFSLLKRSFLLI